MVPLWLLFVKITLGTVYFSLKIQLCPTEIDRSFAIDFREEGWDSFISSTFWCVPAALATARGDSWGKWVALHCKTQFILPEWSISLQYHGMLCVLWVLQRAGLTNPNVPGHLCHGPKDKVNLVALHCLSWRAFSLQPDGKPCRMGQVFKTGSD